MTDQPPIDPERPDGPGRGERLRRILFGGGSIRELERLVEADELDDHYRVVFGRDDMHFRSIGRPRRHRAVVPTIRLLQVRLGYEDPIDPHETQVVFTFTSAETVDENLRSLLEFVTGGGEWGRPPGGDVGTGRPGADDGAPPAPETPSPAPVDGAGIDADVGSTDGEEGGEPDPDLDRRLAEDLLVDLFRLDWLDRNDEDAPVPDLGWVDEAIDARGRLDPEVRHRLGLAVRSIVENLGGWVDDSESQAATRPHDVVDEAFALVKSPVLGPLGPHVEALARDPHTDGRRIHLAYVSAVINFVLGARWEARDRRRELPSEGEEEDA